MIRLSLLGNFFALFVPTLFISVQIPGSTNDPRVTGWIAMFLSMPLTGSRSRDFGTHIVRPCLNHRDRSAYLFARPCPRPPALGRRQIRSFFLKSLQLQLIRIDQTKCDDESF